MRSFSSIFDEAAEYLGGSNTANVSNMQRNRSGTPILGNFSLKVLKRGMQENADKLLDCLIGESKEVELDRRLMMLHKKFSWIMC